ncbi:NUDIX hydrolase [Tupanvirus deep ocean]|uniref:NUDIX hydrolase n=2 Tax=Tupanvirus TaxID=2094720 RepID=A0AC62A854_9VIRU|nr:NUDIX hydrolase [Tupanvirus deep ocean]QKU33951.1 NUDIX hydrolase [Tupanvirus deep ocean]
MEYEISCRRKIMCANCGKPGHEFKTCNEPITSYGIINIDILDNINENLILKDKFSTKKNTYFKVISRKYPEVKCYISDNIKLCEDQNDIYKLDNETIPYEDDEHIRKFCYYKDKILFMMVSRKFSLGFIEFIRGKYDVSDTKTIINLFEQMYEEEIKYIGKNQYDNILYYFLNRNNEPKEVVLNRIYEGRYSNEYCEAKIKFNMLLNPSDDENSDIYPSLDFYTKWIRPRWRKPEWGFPKGRRDKRSEENLTCACREFEEETGYKKDDYNVLNKIEPIEEKMTGTNGISYKHIYYLAINNCDKDKVLTDYDIYEIGDIKWFTYDEAMAHIRPYHIEKKRILTRVYLFILNYLIHNNIHDLS